MFFLFHFIYCFSGYFRYDNIVAYLQQNKPYPPMQDEYYDTPRNIKSLVEVINPYGNYDTPPSPVAVHKKSK